jgi:hypothetical protein
MIPSQAGAPHRQHTSRRRGHRAGSLHASPSERDYLGRERSSRCLVGALEGLRLGEPDPTSSSFEVKLASPRE